MRWAAGRDRRQRTASLRVATRPAAMNAAAFFAAKAELASCKTLEKQHTSARALFLRPFAHCKQLNSRINLIRTQTDASKKFATRRKAFHSLGVAGFAIAAS